MRLLKNFYLLLVISSFLFLASCTTTTAYSDYPINQGESAFWIVSEGDFLNLAQIIAEELQKAGYTSKTILSRPSIPNPQPAATGGSGFSIGKDLIVTNSHVIEGSSQISIPIGGDRFSAEVLLNDKANDLAILKVEGMDFPYSFTLGDLKSYAVADQIYVLGYPIANILGEEIRVTDGIVNAKSGIGNNQKEIQISAQIQPGNSGGPVIDKNFNVIGIASSKLNDDAAYQLTGNIAQNINFAIKSDLLKIVGGPYIENLEVNNKVSNMSESVQATVKVDVTTSSNNPYNTLNNFYIEFGYDSYNYTLTRLNIKCYNLATDELVAEALYSGINGYRSAKGITRNLVHKLIRSMDSLTAPY